MAVSHLLSVAVMPVKEHLVHHILRPQCLETKLIQQNDVFLVTVGFSAYDSNNLLIVLRPQAKESRPYHSYLL